MFFTLLNGALDKTSHAKSRPALPAVSSFCSALDTALAQHGRLHLIHETW